MASDDGINRREFIGTGIVGAAALAGITGCGDGDVTGIASTPIIQPGGPPLTITVADFPELATTGVLVKVAASRAAKRAGTDTFEAFSMRCTHQGCLTRIVDGQRFNCPCHGSSFASDGSVINGPFTGEGIGPLTRLQTSYNPATDELTIG